MFSARHTTRLGLILVFTCILPVLVSAQTVRDEQAPEALQQARQTAATNPRDPQAQIQLAEMALRYHANEEALRAATLAKALAPENPRPLALIAKAQIQSGQYQQGLEAVQAVDGSLRQLYNLSGAAQAAQLVVQSEELLQQIGDSEEPEDYRAAANLLQQAATSAPELMSVRKTLGWLYLEKLHEPQNALPVLEAVGQQTPGDLEGTKLLARAMREMGEFRRAVPLYARIIAREPDNFDQKVEYGKALLGAGQREQAIAQLQEVLQREPENRLAQEALAEANRVEASQPDADQDVQSPQALALLKQANSHVASGDKSGNINEYLQAVQTLEEAIQIEPNSHSLRKTLGWIFLEKLKDAHAAYPHLAQANRLRPNDLPTLKLLALAAFNTGRNCQAIELFQYVLSRDPNDDWMRVNLGRAWAREQEYATAMSLFEQVLSRDPGNYTARLGIAEVQAWRGLSDRPIQLTRQLVSEQPDNSEARSLLGDLYRWDWDFSPAYQQYQTALAYDPRSQNAREGLYELDKAQSFVASLDGYQFVDNFGFDRRFIGGSVRVPLTDKAYITPRVVDWRFEQGAIGFSRTDALFDLEYHFNRHWEAKFRFLNFDYNNDREAEQSVGLDLKFSPLESIDLYFAASENEPAYLTDIGIPLNNIRMDNFGLGFDVDLSKRLSTQGTFNYASYSDSNERHYESIQLSYLLFPCRETYFRVEYESLRFSDFTPDYFSPASFNILFLKTDIRERVFGNLYAFGDFQALNVLGEGWGHSVKFGPEILLNDRIEFRAAYFNVSVPGAENFSGEGFEAFTSVRF